MTAVRPVLAILGLLAASSTLAVPASSSRPANLALPDRIGWGGGPPVHDPARWLKEQLNPSTDDGLPSEIQARIDAMPISRMSLTEIAAGIGEARQALQAERKAMPPTSADAGEKPNTDANTARRHYRQTLQDYGRQAQTRALLRAIHSQNQLKETLAWFWFNHFNVSQRKGVIAAMVGDYEENAIRPHVLGKFRDLLTATAFHPAMLQYLDNQQNAVGRINENFAREIMELHTMGVGSGYTQNDVQELARILTGVGVAFGAQARPHTVQQALRTGSGDIAFNPRRHDFGEKKFLGQTIKGTGADEAEQALLILSRQSTTAHFVSKKLAQFYCCDAPSEALVAAMAATFHKTDGDIRAVLITLFGTPEFTASLGAKFKDPMHYAISAVRATYGETPIRNVTPLINWLQRMGQPLYGRETPDGYALTADAWNGPGAMETRFEIAGLVGAGRQPSLMLPDATSAGRGMMQTAAPGALQIPPPNLKNTPYVQALMPSMAPTSRDALAKTRNSADWNMLFLSSPEFMYR